MGKLLQYLLDSWQKSTESNFRWHILTEIKRYFFGNWGVWHVLNALVSGYVASRRWVATQPDYIVALIFLAAFVLIGVIISLIREAQSRIAWLKEVEQRNLKHQHERLFHFFTTGEIILNRCRKDPTVKIDELFYQWEGEVLDYLDHFSDDGHVNCFLDISGVMSRPSIATGIREEDKDMYLLLHSRITRLRQFYGEVERKAPPGTFDVRHSSPFQSL